MATHGAPPTPVSDMELFQDFLNHGSVCLHVVDTNGIIQWANQTELDLLGYTAEEYIGQDVTKFHADQAIVGDILGLLLSGEKVVNAVAPLVCKDGRIEYVEINSSTRRVDGEVSTTRCFSAVVTDKVHAAKMQQELIQAELETNILRQQSEAKSAFMRTLCHELRNPMTAVQGSSELLATQLNKFDKDSKDGRSFAETLEVTQKLIQDVPKMSNYCNTTLLSLNHMSSILNESLMLSKIEAEDGVVLQASATSLLETVETVVAMFAVVADAKGIYLTVDTDLNTENDVSADVDACWMRQILINLLSNAIKFTSEGGVTLRVHTEMGSSQVVLRVRVEDTGIGMTPEEQANLFKLFSQANATISGKYGGSGLGLELVQRVLGKMGTSVQVESEKGKGTAFYFEVTLPLSTTEELQVTPDNSPPRRRAARGNRRGSLGMMPAEKPESPAPPPAVQVLIAEDDSAVVVMLRDQLETLGCIITATTDGDQAIKAAESTQFDLIFMDINMPIKDGLQATMAIRNGGQNKDTPIVGLSAHYLAEDVDRANQAGMNAYIQKPYKTSNLIEMIKVYTTHDTCAESPAPKKTPCRFLVVDDNQAVRETLVGRLGLLDPESVVEQASKGEEGARLAREGPFDLIFIDLDLGDMSGIDVTKQIRVSGVNKDTPCVCLSGSTDENLVVNVLSQGMSDFVTKPYSIQDIERMLRKHLQNGRVRRGSSSEITNRIYFQRGA
eukprot:TRINITY_DN850_c0_g3_i1.p1 TRINITY_DN850_c0_g3~~TRINITY_DN850_c0_g3_i1.p1  ORF type:complete len:728 (+),score=209.51 TRINITY_DN850_c0_g3_i1:197-2380(+)